MGCQQSTPDYILPEIAQKLKQFRNERKEIELPKTIESFDHFCEILRNIVRSLVVPKKFHSTLANSISNNIDLKTKLQELKILDLFEWEKGLFKYAIGWSSIKNAVEIIDNIKEESGKSAKPLVVKNVDNLINPSIEDKCLLTKNKFASLEVIEVCNEFRNVFGDSFRLMSYEDFIRLTPLMEKPKISLNDLNVIFFKVMPYLIQKIKMWGCNAMTTENVYGLIEGNDNKFQSNARSTVRKPRRISGSVKSIKNDLREIQNNVSVSRLDFLNGIMNCVDPLVAEDILSILSKFSISLPLIIPDLQNKDSFKVNIKNDILKKIFVLKLKLNSFILKFKIYFIM
jgi:hypothetical protein